MTNPTLNAVLDLPADLLPQLASFAAGVQRLTFSQLVVIIGRLDCTRQSAKRAQASAAEVSGLSAEFMASLAVTDIHVAAMFDLVEAELERRLSARPDLVEV